MKRSSHRRHGIALRLPILLPLILAAAPAMGQGGLTIEVDNVRSSKGHVRLDVCPESLFLKDNCPASGAAPAHVGRTIVTISGLRPGRYAVQAYLDENDNQEVDRGLFGIPKEGVGFSNDAPIRLSPPKFKDAAFDFYGGNQVIKLDLRYFTGPKGPPAGAR